MSYLGEEIPKLGFGLMRLPQKDGKIDVEQTKKMVDRFMEEGYTYFDTAWAYPGSEDAIRQALVERYPREKYQLATKNAAWIGCKTREDAIKMYETSLAQTGAGYFDFYLLHNLGDARTQVFEEFDLWNYFLGEREKGRIKHLGFSLHASAEQLEEILKKHPEAEFVQLQINYGDWEDASVQSRRCYEVARKYDVPVIIMEPVKGGLLARPPEAVKRLLKEKNPSLTPAGWAIRFCADLDGIVTVLSGMSSIEQMEDSLACMRGFRHLSEDEKSTLVEARKIIESVGAIPCTSCNYCAKVCPNDIGISGALTGMNYIKLYNDVEFAKGQVKWNIDGAGRKRPSNCVKCGACEDVCPQHLKIVELLESTVPYFG